MLKCLRMENNTQKCIKALLGCISNLVVNTSQDALKIVNHQIFG